MVGVGYEATYPGCGSKIAVVDAVVDDCVFVVGAEYVTDKSACLKSAGNITVVDAVFNSYGCAGVAALYALVDVTYDTTCNARAVAFDVGADGAVVDGVLYGKTDCRACVIGVTYDTARCSVFVDLGGVGESDVTVVGAVFDGGGLSGVTDDTACAVCRGDVGSVVAISYGDCAASVVAEDTAGGIAVLAAVGVDDSALVEAVLKKGIYAVAASYDTAYGSGAGDRAFVDASHDLTGNIRAVDTTDDTADLAVVSAYNGHGRLVGDVFNCSALAFACYRACGNIGIGGDLYLTGSGKIFDSSVELLEHRNGYGNGLAVAIESTGEVSFIGSVYGDVCREVVCTVGGHVLEVFSIVDGGSFGSKYADREKGNDHKNADDKGYYFAHDVYLFLSYLRY